MKNFLVNVTFAILVFAVGFLAVRVVHYQAQVRLLQDRVAELERNRVVLQQELRAPTNQTATVATPEDLRRTIEQAVSTRRYMNFRAPVVYQTVSPDGLREICVKDALRDWPPSETHDYVRSLVAFGLIPGDADLTNVLASVYDDRVGAHYSWRDKTLYVADNLELTQRRSRVILSRELLLVLQDQNWNLAGLLTRVKDNDDQTLARTAFVYGDMLLSLNRLYANDPDHMLMAREIGQLMNDLGEKLRYVPTFLRDRMLFPYQEGFQYAIKLEGRWQYGFQWPTTTSQIYHPEKTRTVGGAQKDTGTPITLAPVDSTTWRLIGNNVLGEFGIRELLQSRLRSVDAELAARGWDGDRYNVYERDINGPTGILWRTIWETESDAEEFEDAYRDLVRRAKITAHIVRDGVYVTVIQSADPSFDAFAQEALKRSGITLPRQP